MSHTALAGAGREPLGSWAAAQVPGDRTPVQPKPPPVRGTVHIRVERCKGCELCIEYCPTRVLALSSEFNTAGYHYPVIVSDDCVACQSCTTICPEYAIFAVAVPTYLAVAAAT